MMPFKQERKRSRLKLTGVQGGIHVFVLVLAVGLLLFQMFSSTIFAFTEDYWFGIRSLAAAVFPLSVALYFSFLARIQLPTNRSPAPIINNYVIFVLWTLLLFGLDGTNELIGFPLEELLYSLTLAFMVWRFKRQDSFKDLLACCYGVLSGSLAAIIVFGWNPTTL